VLIETMRREGFELSLSPPSVLFRTVTDEQGKNPMREEPYEALMVDVGEEFSGKVIERCAERKAELKEFTQMGAGKVRLEFYAPSRGLIGECGGWGGGAERAEAGPLLRCGLDASLLRALNSLTYICISPLSPSPLRRAAKRAQDRHPWHICGAQAL
jgi:hypothetical protein